MNHFLAIALLSLVLNTSLATAQQLPHFQEFDKALINRDTATLNRLTHAQLTMGHSNGWLQNKEDLLHSITTNYVDYIAVKQIENPTVFFQTDGLIVTRRDIDVQGIVNKYTFDVKLNVLENWVFIEDTWVLLSRQSVNRKTE